MNVKSIRFLVLALFVISCKSTEVNDEYIDLITYCSENYKEGFIEKNPLILLNSKPIGLLSEISIDNFKYKEVNSKSITVIPKGLDYLKRFWGENAKNGIIQINRSLLLHCGTPPNSIYLLDDNEVSFKKIQDLDSSEIMSVKIISDVLDEKENYNKIMIFITKKWFSQLN